MCFECCCLPVPVSYDSWTPPLYAPSYIPTPIPTIYGRTVPGYGLGVAAPVVTPGASLRGRVTPITPSYGMRTMPGTRVFNAPPAMPVRGMAPSHVFAGAHSGPRVAVGRR